MYSKSISDDIIYGEAMKFLGLLDSFIESIPKNEIHSLSRRLSQYETKFRSSIDLAYRTINQNKKLKVLIEVYASVNAINDYLEFVGKLYGLNIEPLITEISSLNNSLQKEYPKLSAFMMDKKFFSNNESKGFINPAYD